MKLLLGHPVYVCSTTSTPNPQPQEDAPFLPPLSLLRLGEHGTDPHVESLKLLASQQTGAMKREVRSTWFFGGRIVVDVIFLKLNFGGKMYRMHLLILPYFVCTIDFLGKLAKDNRIGYSSFFFSGKHSTASTTKYAISITSRGVIAVATVSASPVPILAPKKLILPPPPPPLQKGRRGEATLKIAQPEPNSK